MLMLSMRDIIHLRRMEKRNHHKIEKGDLNNFNNWNGNVRLAVSGNFFLLFGTENKKYQEQIKKNSGFHPTHPCIDQILWLCNTFEQRNEWQVLLIWNFTDLNLKLTVQRERVYNRCCKPILSIVKLPKSSRIYIKTPKVLSFPTRSYTHRTGV